jgi:hypothetical protein
MLGTNTPKLNSKSSDIRGGDKGAYRACPSVRLCYYGLPSHSENTIPSSLGRPCHEPKRGIRIAQGVRVHSFMLDVANDGRRDLSLILGAHSLEDRSKAGVVPTLDKPHSRSVRRRLELVDKALHDTGP